MNMEGEMKKTISVVFVALLAAMLFVSCSKAGEAMGGKGMWAMVRVMLLSPMARAPGVPETISRRTSRIWNATSCSLATA